MRSDLTLHMHVRITGEPQLHVLNRYTLTGDCVVDGRVHIYQKQETR